MCLPPVEAAHGSLKLGARCLVGSHRNTAEISAAPPSCRRTRADYERSHAYSARPIAGSIPRGDGCTARPVSVRDRWSQTPNTHSHTHTLALISRLKAGFHGCRSHAEASLASVKPSSTRMQSYRNMNIQYVEYYYVLIRTLTHTHTDTFHSQVCKNYYQDIISATLPAVNPSIIKCTCTTQGSE